MKILQILFILFSGIVLLPMDSYSQKDSADILSTKIKYMNPEGNEFWLCFQKNFKEPKKKSDSENQLFLELFITGDKDANVAIEIEALDYKTSFFVPGGTVKNVKIPSEAQVLSEEIIERLAVHVVSDNAISVYGLNRRKQTTDTYLGLPTKVLGNEYRVMCYTVSEGLMPQFAIIATEDNTEVTITPSVNTTKHPANISYKVNMKKGDVYQVVANFEMKSSCDLTGSIVKANKDIAVFSGHQCAYVTPRVIACNHLTEQMPPLNSWGKHFYIGMMKRRSIYTYRILANENDTKIFEDNKLIKILNGGEYFESNSRKNIQITASKPVLVAQYSQGFRNGDSIGDPMMLMISPTQQFLKHYRFATPINGSWRHYVNVVVPTKAINTIRVDSAKVDSSAFETLGISRYSIGSIEIPFGPHTIEADLPFGMYSYGFGYEADAFDAYGTMGGQSFVEIDETLDTLPPMAEEKISNDMITVIARDDRIDDTGLKRIDVDFSQGIKFEIPKIEEGTSQVLFTIKPENSLSQGKAIITIGDASANTVQYTVCYVFDPKTERNVFLFSQGEIEECKPDPGFQLGIFGKYSFDSHLLDFNNSAGYDFKGSFDSKLAKDFNFGLYFGRRFWDQINLSARLSFEKYSGVFTAIGQIDSIRDENSMQLKPYQQSKTLELDGINMHLNLMAEYYMTNIFYLCGGLDFALNLSDAVIIKDNILQPEDYTFTDGTTSHKAVDAPDNLSSISSLRLLVNLGCGINFPIITSVSGFSELNIGLPINSIINDDSWYLFRFSILAGIKYRF